MTNLVKRQGTTHKRNAYLVEQDGLQLRGSEQSHREAVAVPGRIRAAHENNQEGKQLRPNET